MYKILRAVFILLIAALTAYVARIDVFAGSFSNAGILGGAAGSVLFAVISLASGVCFLVCVFLLFKKNRQLIELEKAMESADAANESENILSGLTGQSKKVIDFAPLVYVLTMDGIVKDANVYAKEMLGINLGDDFRCKYFEPGAREEIIEKLEHSGYLSGEIVELLTATNEANRFFINISQIDNDGDRKARILWGINVESAERQRDAIERGQRDMKSLIDAFPMPIFIFDPVIGSTLYGNAASASMFEHEQQSGMAGNNTFKLLFSESSDSDLSEAIDEIIMSGEPVVKTTVYETPGKEAITLKAICMNFVYLGISAVIVIMQDISAEIKEEEMLKKLAEREKEASELKSRFIVNMSHEIRTPLNAILGLSEIQLAGGSDKRDSSENFKKINASAKNLLAIVDDILDFSKLGAEKLEITNATFEIEEVLQSALLLASQRAGEKPVEVLADISPKLPYKLIGDRRRLWQALKNLLDNAAKFTDSGFVTLTARQAVDDGSGKIIVEFIVEDTGVGMTDGQLDKIFNPFEQLHNKEAKSEGTGIGLTISKQIINLMGGTIDVSSEYGSGTRITVRIPFQRVENTPAISEKIGDAVFCGKRALVIGASQFNEITLRKLLDSVGIEPFFSRDTDVPICEYDVLIADITAAEKSEFVWELVKTGAAMGRTLIMASQSFMEKAGFEQLYIEKPFTPSAFTAKLYELFKGGEHDEAGGRLIFPNAKVLLCEDNAINQEVAAGMLEIYGIVPVIAENGAEAIRLLESQEFDLVFMDILMPVLNGHDATVRIRSSEKHYKDVPIVAMTANVFQDEIDKCYQEGMNGYLVKPIAPEQIYEELLKWLSGEVARPCIDKSVEVCEGFPLIDGIDVSDGIKRFMNKREKYEKALISFSSELSRSVGEIETAVGTGNFPAARASAHKIKGVSANLGATALHEMSAALEQRYKNNESDDELLKRFMDKSAETKKQIESNFKYKRGGGDNAKAYGSAEEAFKLLRELNDAVKRFDPEEAEKAIALLRNKKWEQLEGSALDNIYSLIDSYMFAEAEEVIEGILIGGGHTNG